MTFKIDLDQKNENILKTGYYQRILPVSKYAKRVGAFFLFFQNSIRRSLNDNNM